MKEDTFHHYYKVTLQFSQPQIYDPRMQHKLNFLEPR